MARAEEVLTDLIATLRERHRHLLDRAEAMESKTAAKRLVNKADGVGLALSFVEEALRGIY